MNLIPTYSEQGIVTSQASLFYYHTQFDITPNMLTSVQGLLTTVSLPLAQIRGQRGAAPLSNLAVNLSERCTAFNPDGYFFLSAMRSKKNTQTWN